MSGSEKRKKSYSNHHIVIYNIAKWKSENRNKA